MASKIVTFSLEVRTAPDFFLAVAPMALVVDKGAVASFTLTSTIVGAHTGHLQLSLAGLPAGVTPSFSINPMAAPGTSILTIPTANIPVGVLSLVLTGTEVA